MKSPSADCGHVFVLNCAADGIAADGVLINNGKGSSCSEVTVKEAEEGAKVKFYQAGSPSSAKDLMPLYESFLDQGAKHFKGEWSSFRRAKPLLAFDPTAFFPSNIDIDDTAKTSVLRDLSSFVYSIADTFGVDIALCVPEEKNFLSVKELRKECCPFEGGPFWMLSDSQKSSAMSLARSVKAGRLVIFIGAGVSIPSGAPSWGGLLDQLAIEAGMNEEDRESLKKLGFLDQPTILAEDMGSGFKSGIAAVVNKSSRYTPVHALLKTLKSPAITTNYDDLYERAAISCDQHVPTLPWDSRKMIQNSHSEKNSLLKLHGCVNHPESIVLSRSDYMRYPDTSQALRGRLHGMFLTNEVLFCGFSMTDDNVHKIIDDVRKVLYVDGELPNGNKLGTILTMTENKMFTRLWDQDFEVNAFGKSWGDNPAWYHDCFLDSMVASALE